MTSPLLSAEQFEPHANDAAAIDELRKTKTRFRLTPRGRVWAVVANQIFGDDDVPSCERLPHMIWFCNWSLKNAKSKLTDDGVTRLAQLPQIQAIDINNNPNVTDSSLSASSNNSKLRWLAYNGCSITNRGVEALSNASWLLRLALRQTKIDDHCIPALCKLTELRILRIDGTKISKSGYEKIRPALPRCRTLGLNT